MFAGRFEPCECPWYVPQAKHRNRTGEPVTSSTPLRLSRSWCLEVLMGDLNTGYYQPSQQLLRKGQMEAFGRHWNLPMTFTDAWAELHPGNPDPSTINNDPVRLDARGSNFAQPFCEINKKVKGQHTSSHWINTCLQDFADLLCICSLFFSLALARLNVSLIIVISSVVSFVTRSHVHCVLL